MKQIFTRVRAAIAPVVMPLALGAVLTSCGPGSQAALSTLSENEAVTGAEAASPALAVSALPEGVTPGSPAAAAWDALMAADGEYAAFAQYGAVIEKFGAVEPYVTIQQAEERHADALIRQLDRLGVAVPDNPYLGQVDAPADLQQAASAWAEGEVANVALYDDLMTQVQTDPNLPRVFTNLRRASQDMHLPMFAAAAQGDGTLTADQMDGFIQAHEEDGNHQGESHSQGQGSGKGLGGGNGQGNGNGRGQSPGNGKGRGQSQGGDT